MVPGQSQLRLIYLFLLNPGRRESGLPIDRETEVIRGSEDFSCYDVLGICENESAIQRIEITV
jgi:hypothetical protein